MFLFLISAVALLHRVTSTPADISLTSGTCACTQYGGGYCSGFCSGTTCPCMNCQYWNQTCGYGLPADVKQVPEDQDQYKDMMEIVQARGYPIESHLVTTSDGYELTMFRIPYGKTGEQTVGGRPPVLLQHGLLDSSYTWVNNFETESLGYILADNGFDVWFGNNRGNTYGRSHVMLDPDDGTEEFWKFSWDEMAYYDIPAFVNHIISDTGYESLGYIGHSEGTIQMFAAASSTAESDVLRDVIAKINIFVALAPVAYVSNLHSEILVKLAHSDIIQVLVLIFYFNSLNCY